MGLNRPCVTWPYVWQGGHQITLLNHTKQPREVRGVRCLSLPKQPLAEVLSPCDAVVISNAAEVCLQVRPHCRSGTLLILWTGHSFDQPAMAALDRPEVRQGWDLIASVSDWHRRTMVERYHLDPSRVVVLRNAIAPAFEGLFQTQEDLVQAKGSRLELVFTSTPFRGLDVLLSVFPEVRREHAEAELHVYSSMKVYQQEEAGDKFRYLYERCRATAGVRFFGSIQQPALARALTSATMLSYPCTFAETSCIAVMEAMAAGLFVATSDLGACARR